MQLHALHLDDALTAQPDFLAALNARGATALDAMADGAHVRLWGRFPEIDALKRKIADFMRDAANNNPNNKSLTPCVYMGSGDFHHISALLQEIVLETQPEPVTIIHFDNHPDWVKHDHNLHCGSWVNRSAANPNIAKIITIGVTSADLINPERQHANLSLLRDGKLELFPYFHAPSHVTAQVGDGAGHTQRDGHLHWQNIKDQSADAFIAMLLTRISTKNVYLTIDKDVLDRADAITNWDQGGMRLAQLLQIITAIGRAHPIIGVDVNGDYSKPRYKGDLGKRFLKHAEILLDQSWHAPSPIDTMLINQTSNFALLNTLSEVMA